jgi:signal transduction histidine kinase
MSLVNGRERRLTIAADFDGKEVAVAVSDTGNGIDPTQLDQIFDFFATKSGGMGLGLSICRSIIKGHGGRLWASARSPAGTTFHLLLLSAETRRS